MIKFGTDGWRARIAEDFTFQNVKTVAEAFSLFVGKASAPVVIGYDNRFLSEHFAGLSAETVVSNGIDVLLAESSCPTPAVSFFVKKYSSPAGIMITASHNPFDWNGFKVKGSFAGSATPEMTKRIEALLDKASPKNTPAGKIKTFDPKKDYLESVSKMVDLDLISGSGVRVVVDCLFGSGSGYLKTVLKDLIKIEEINDRRDPLFGGVNPEPITPNLKALIDKCGREKVVGLALDGDADRIGAVGSDGVFINTHQVFALLLHHLVKNKKMAGSVVKTFNVTHLIDEMCEKYGLRLYVRPIGFKHVCDLMLKEDILIGGEESGGFGIKGHIPERDGILCALLLIELMAAEKKNLEEILADISKEFHRYYYDRVDIRIDDQKKNAVMEKLSKAPPKEMASLKVKDIRDMDGIKLIFEDGSWVLLRASGTEPLLRIYCEATRKEDVERLLKEACDLAK
ncbi:MAG: phosphoglucomutase/phosphomannomutase family protein [Candidatus Saganbacteria bacterium]|nr:phosphoglucomutase/phosphomannomutase family protein [Candidatus Saganbacteria bacterium]